MREIETPEFASDEEEAEFWDNFDTADYMEDDGEWFQFLTPSHPAVKVAVLPEVIGPLMNQAEDKGVSLETLVNVLLAKSAYEYKRECQSGRRRAHDIDDMQKSDNEQRAEQVETATSAHHELEPAIT